MFIMLGIIFSRQTIEIFFFFFFFWQKTGFDIACKFSPMETICMKCQILSAGKNKKKINQFVICSICPESDKG